MQLNQRFKVDHVVLRLTACRSTGFEKTKVHYMKHNVTIKVNDPQPVDCPECKSKEGYQYSDFMQMRYTSIHNADGKYEMGGYSDYSKTLNKAKTAYCCTCGTKLPFKLERLNTEDVSA